ncbi:uncharacterized protein I206_107238 [Kwoniella pini CBS 10737]|uniref:Uncharacterized protein n=1 Tax=Kwoniella pini CBS 10737 TaxID=1296096 RepID=A0A1B9HYS8_9TREE|nr:uncharacterized protein I206_05217 [Kwoniella pini CBS 10737]OCF48439.1 hypothetical protein I206_05217 [Kwoniella pini CBS 10737]
MKIGLCEDQPINSSDKSEKSSFFDLFHHTNVKTDSGRQGIAYSSGDCYSEDDSLSIQSRGSERKPNENPSTRMESSYQAIVNEWKDKLRWNGLDEQSYL